jgi:hypothetical protein
MARWIDIWFGWLDQFRHLIIREIPPHPCMFCHRPMMRTHSVTPGISHFECIGCRHSATQRDFP